MDLTGDNEVAHNCTDSGATLYDSHIAKYTDAEAIAAVPFVLYVPCGTEESYAP